MGVLFNFSLTKLISEGFDTLVETGTGTGTAVDYGLKSGFKRIFSTEIMPDQAMRLQERYKENPEVQIYNLYSPNFLDTLFREDIIKKDDKCIFWLDAHYPGGDLGYNSYGHEQDLFKRLPLEKELETLLAYKRANDIIIIDDLRIYEHGPFEDKNLDEIGHTDISRYDAPDFLGLWKNTHNIQKLYTHTGYVILKPKDL